MFCRGKQKNGEGPPAKERDVQIVEKEGEVKNNTKNVIKPQGTTSLFIYL